MGVWTRFFMGKKNPGWHYSMKQDWQPNLTSETWGVREGCRPTRAARGVRSAGRNDKRPKPYYPRGGAPDALAGP
jgi:hypothetical protein